MHLKTTTNWYLVCYHLYYDCTSRCTNDDSWDRRGLDLNISCWRSPSLGRRNHCDWPANSSPQQLLLLLRLLQQGGGKVPV